MIGINQNTFPVAVPVTVLNGFAFVIEFFAAAEADFEFGAPRSLKNSFMATSVDPLRDSSEIISQISLCNSKSLRSRFSAWLSYPLLAYSAINILEMNSSPLFSMP